MSTRTLLLIVIIAAIVVVAILIVSLQGNDGENTKMDIVDDDVEIILDPGIHKADVYLPIKNLGDGVKTSSIDITMSYSVGDYSGSTSQRTLEEALDSPTSEFKSDTTLTAHVRCDMGDLNQGDFIIFSIVLSDSDNNILDEYVFSKTYGT